MMGDDAREFKMGQGSGKSNIYLDMEFSLSFKISLLDLASQ